MSVEGSSKADQDLLARLNALKKSHIDLDDQQYRIPVTAHVQESVEPSPAKALQSDLLSRFNSLNGKKAPDQDQNLSSSSNQDDILAEEDSKTVEQLLSELSGEGSWNIEKDEATQIDDLLRNANTALNDMKFNGATDLNDDLKPGNQYTHELPSIDIEFSQPTTEHEDFHDSDDEKPRKSKAGLNAELERDADDLIAKLKDELKNELKNAPPDLPTSPTFTLSTIPTADPAADDDDLANRFASLTLPTTLPSVPSTKPGPTPKFGSSARYAGHTEEEIERWCVICCEDATLRCVGCDGDPYCTKCWLEGHRSSDAGYEERTHKAVQFNKGAKKETRRRVAA